MNLGRYMLDTNTVSYIMRQHGAVTRRFLMVPMASLCLSSITVGELQYWLAKRPEATRLRAAATEFLRGIEVLPWEQTAAETYGIARANLWRQGRSLGLLDLLIASHALSIDAVLVTSDRAFGRVRGLRIEDWTID